MLNQYLLEDYDPSALPNDGDTTVKIEMRLFGIKEVDTLNSVIILKVGFYQRWTDQRLVWDPEDFGGEVNTTIFSNPDSNAAYIWTPEIILRENAVNGIYDDM